MIRTPSITTALIGGRGGARRAAAPRRLVAYVGPRPLRRGRPPLHRRPGERDDHHRGDEHPAGRDRARARGPRRGARGGRRRRPRPGVGRDAGGVCPRRRAGRVHRRRSSTSGSRSHLAGFKRPRHVFLSLDPIPRASGESKIARGDIKKLIRSWVAEPASSPVTT